MLPLSIIPILCLIPFFTLTCASPTPTIIAASSQAGNTTINSSIGPINEVTPLSAEEISELISFAQFARAAYCAPPLLEEWTCGEACNALPDFVPTLVGGDGNLIQNYYVGYWESRQAIVVGHEGTDPTQLLALLTDLDTIPVPLHANLFPGIPPGVRVHRGFRNEHATTANLILNEVERLMNGTGSKTVITTGHSLGGVLAVLDSLFFALHLPKDTHIISRTFGTPRVGNTQFARLIDSSIVDFNRINNRRDVIPIVPLRSMGFAHPKGEIHMSSPQSAVYCPGDDDVIDRECSDWSVPFVILGNLIDHLGPYPNGIEMGTIFCI